MRISGDLYSKLRHKQMALAAVECRSRCRPLFPNTLVNTKGDYCRTYSNKEH